MRLIKLASLAVLPFLLAAAPAATTSRSVIPAPVPIAGKLGTPIDLYNGKDFTGWTFHPLVAGTKIDAVWNIKDGTMHSFSKPPSTATLDTEKEYKNFVLTVEYRHLTKDNGGVFVCLTGEERVWPNAIQVQGKFGAVGDLINQNTGMKKMTTDPARTKVANKDVLITRIVPSADKPAEKPLGEWNTLIITMENGNLNVTNNGVLLNTAKDIDPPAGKIGLQAEGAEMEFRKIQLTPIE